MIDRCLLVCHDSCAVCTDSGAGSTSDTKFLVYMWLSGTMHLHLTGTGTTSHTNVLQRATKSGCFMSLKMCQCKEYIRIHNGASDLRFFYIFAAFYRYQNVICSLQSIANQDMASSRIWCKAIQISTLDVIQCILTATYIQRIAVCQVWFSTQFFYNICNGSGIVWTKKCQIARFTEMNLDRYILILKINVRNTGFFYQFRQFQLQIGIRPGTQIGKVYF